MSSRKIPEREVLTCDRCGADGERYSSGAFASGGFHIARAMNWGRGVDGAAGGADVSFDFCADCAVSFDSWRREKPGHAKTNQGATTSAALRGEEPDHECG